MPPDAAEPENTRRSAGAPVLADVRLLAALAVVAVGWGAAVLLARDDLGPSTYLASGVPAGWMLIMSGLVAWWTRPTNRTGRIMVLAGFATLLRTLQATLVPALFTVGTYLSQLPTVLFAYLVLSYPRGRLSTTAERAVLVLAALVFAADLSGTFFYDPRDLGCADCPAGLNLLLVQRDPALLAVFLRLTGFISVAASAGLFALVLVRTVRATAPARRILWPVYLPTLLIVLDGLVGSVYFWILLRPQVFPPWFILVESIVRLLLPVAFLLGLLRLRLRRSRLGDLIVDLGHPSGPGRLRDAVSRVLGDGTVDVGFHSEHLAAYVTANGERLVLPPEGDPRTATFLEREGRPLAVLVHDRALEDDPKLLEAVTAAARMAIENEQLHAEVRAQLEEVRLSRSRIVEAADAERRRIERDLHDGAQQRLVALSMALRMAEDRAKGLGDPALVTTLAGAADDLGHAVSELRQLAAGVHPGILDEGLGAALEELAERSAIPVNVCVMSDDVPAPLDSTVYFFVCEALTNATKHSFASEVTVTVDSDGRRVTVEVRDDGIGGADPSRGSGLRGLEDRLASVDGSLDLSSPPGRGTKLTVEMPCASSSPTTRS